MLLVIGLFGVGGAVFTFQSERLTSKVLNVFHGMEGNYAPQCG
jgi:Tfp pilus assembly protein PilX